MGRGAKRDQGQGDQGASLGVRFLVLGVVNIVHKRSILEFVVFLSLGLLLWLADVGGYLVFVAENQVATDVQIFARRPHG